MWGEMSEYTQRIHPQAKDGWTEPGAMEDFYPQGNSLGISHYQFVTLTSQCNDLYTNSGGANITPAVWQLDECNLNTREDIQHIEKGPWSKNSANFSNVSTASNDSLGAGTRQRSKDGRTSATNAENPAPVSDSRLNCPSYVCLKDLIQSEWSAGQEEPDPPNILAPLVQSPSLIIGLQQQHNGVSIDNTGALWLPYSDTGPLCSAAPSCTQPSICRLSGFLLEAAKLHELSPHSNFSLFYQQEMEFNKDRGSSKNKLAAEQTWNDALWKQVFNQRSQSPPGQDDAGIELSALNKIQNLGQQTSNAAVGVSEIPTLSSTGDPEQHGKSIGRSQRREKHNRMEMERRHRLNMYIDELRLYVPFCNIATDKATTLKWTVSFVKYIQEQHGDSLKKAFESAHNRTAEMMMEGNQCKCCSANPRHHLHAGCHVTPW